MFKQKRLAAILLFAVLLTGILSGCGLGSTQKSGKLSIVTTIFPEYDWVMQILGDRAADMAVTLLLDGGVDMHSYQPTADDIIRISDCDLFLCVGGESDEWTQDALKNATNRDMTVIRLLDTLGDKAKEEEPLPGAEPEHKAEKELDEHVWLSLKNAALFVASIRDALCRLDGEHADAYTKNAEAYLEKLNALDGKYQSAVDGAKVKTVVFADRFPFRYLTDDYGLTYYAAFPGCSAESEASFETISFLAGKVDELKLSAILTLEGGNRKIAETVANTAATKNLRILVMDSMQSTTSEDIRKGTTYLSVMEKNLAVLKEAGHTDWKLTKERHLIPTTGFPA